MRSISYLLSGRLELSTVVSCGWRLGETMHGLAQFSPIGRATSRCGMAAIQPFMMIRSVVVRDFFSSNA